jgi:F0F1-type ATP synthase assembly protein I
MTEQGDKPNRTTGPSGVELIGLGFGLAVAVVLPLLAGLWLDAAKHTSPLGVGAGLLLGIVAATTLVIQRFKRYW